MKHTINILIVEDDKTIGEELESVYTKIFEEEDFTVKIQNCTNGEQAKLVIENFTSDNNKFDFISLDLNLSSKANFNIDGYYVGAMGTDILELANDYNACKGVVIVSGISIDDKIEEVEKKSVVLSDLRVEKLKQAIQPEAEKFFKGKIAVFQKTIGGDISKTIEDNKNTIFTVCGLYDEPEYGWVKEGNNFVITFFNKNAKNEEAKKEKLIVSVTNPARWIQKLLTTPNPLKPWTPKALRGSETMTLPDELFDEPEVELVDGEKIRHADYDAKLRDYSKQELRKTIVSTIKNLGNRDEIDTVDKKITIEFLLSYQSALYAQTKSNSTYQEMILWKIKYHELNIKEILQSRPDEKDETDASYDNYQKELEQEGLILLKLYVANNKDDMYAEQITLLKTEIGYSDTSSSFDEINNIRQRKKYTPQGGLSRSNISNQIKKFIFKLKEDSGFYNEAPGLIDHLIKSFGCEIKYNKSKSCNEKCIANAYEYKLPQDELISWVTRKF